MGTKELSGKSFKDMTAWLSRPSIVFFTLPGLMLLLVCGTVAQRFIGLYDAQRMFFGSFIFWLGPIPLPGGYSLITLISVALLTKFLFHSTWSLKKAGINLSHLGVLILLGGGLLTALRAQEGYIIIPEGGRAEAISDYHQRELVIIKDGVLAAAVPYGKIKAGKTLRFEGLPFSIIVQNACRNCRIGKREEATETLPAPLRGMAQFMALSAQKPEKEDEENLHGATILLKDAGADFNGAYVLFEAMPKPVRIEKGGAVYEIFYGRQQRPLPFALRLEKFTKTLYPGTAMPSGYSSDIIVEEKGVSWPARIEMNKPLRYRGYTFFQSSFVENGAGQATVLAAVKNTGWLFPYIGVTVIAAGLLLHVLIIGKMGRSRA